MPAIEICLTGPPVQMVVVAFACQANQPPPVTLIALAFPMALAKSRPAGKGSPRRWAGPARPPDLRADPRCGGLIPSGDHPGSAPCWGLPEWMHL